MSFLRDLTSLLSPLKLSLLPLVLASYLNGAIYLSSVTAYRNTNGLSFNCWTSVMVISDWFSFSVGTSNIILLDWT